MIRPHCRDVLYTNVPSCCNFLKQLGCLVGLLHARLNNSWANMATSRVMGRAAQYCASLQPFQLKMSYSNTDRNWYKQMYALGCRSTHRRYPRRNSTPGDGSSVACSDRRQRHRPWYRGASASGCRSPTPAKTMKWTRRRRSCCVWYICPQVCSLSCRNNSGGRIWCRGLF